MSLFVRAPEIMQLSECPAAWRESLADEFAQPYFRDLAERLQQERAAHNVYPPREQTFRALELCAPHEVKVVLLGQDPYHGAGQAEGLCFSVPAGVRFPPSLRNIFAELKSDCGCETPASGSLVPWGRQGVLLLNSVLSVREGKAGSHQRWGWERFTDRIIQLINELPGRVVFLLWGRPAQRKAALISAAHHVVLQAAHPSPLSAHSGFFGSRPFSQANQALREAGRKPIHWCLNGPDATG